MTQKIVFCDYGNVLDAPTRMAAYKKCGILNISPPWGEEFAAEATRFALYDEAKKHDLNIDIVHLDYKQNFLLWTPGPEGDAVANTHIARISECVTRGIKVGVFHPTYSARSEHALPIGIARIKKIVRHCEKVGFTLAAENIHAHTHFEKTVNTIKSPNCKILFDIGHANCFTRDGFNVFTKYKDRIIATHLHNNFGEADDHNPLSAGTIDFQKFFSRENMAGNVIQYHLLEIAPRNVNTAGEFETFLINNLDILKKLLYT